MFAPAAAIFALLLVATGIAKLRKPEDTAIALSKMGLPRHSLIGLVLGAVEVAVGISVLATMNAATLTIQALLYIGFAAWVTAALVRGVPIASCGCMGTDDTPPYWGHLAVDAVATAVTVMAVLAGPLVYPGQVVGAVAVMVVIPLGAYLCWMIIGDGARLHGAQHR